HLLIIVLGLGLSCILIACGGHDVQTFYPSLADADRNGAITRGWIPYFLPSSSRSIHVVGDLSPSTEWCAFEFLPADSQSLRKKLKNSVDVLPQSISRVPNPRVPWWPAILKGTINAARVHEAGFELYVLVEPATSVTTSTSLFAINWQKGI